MLRELSPEGSRAISLAGIGGAGIQGPAMLTFGNAAVDAVRICEAEKACPDDGWLRAVAMAFPSSKSMRDKSCPRAAFLGLCEQGLVKGIRAGKYTRSLKNKVYAVAAVSKLRKNSGLEDRPQALWKAVMNGKTKTHNEQMVVVIALWKAGLICD